MLKSSLRQAIYTKQGAANLMMATVVMLIILKIVAGLMTHSISVLAQAADSFLDILAAFITIITVRISAKPADEGHPFGHGKIEDFGSLAQGILILITSGAVIYSAVQRIINKAPLQETWLGMIVMAISIVVSIFLARYLSKVARATSSSVLEANAANITADIYTAAVVLAGLLIVRFTPFALIDPIIAIAVAVYIVVKIVISSTKKTVSKLIDAKLDEAEHQIIIRCITEFKDQIVEFHELRTRQSGSQRYIDLHLVLPMKTDLQMAHGICDSLESYIEKELANSNVFIHVEPCNAECAECEKDCSDKNIN
ncbi:MAG: cation diffusion facilitator family transporter [Chloroflexi bacterium]|nr:cation diffusion facilitator family transporter [Chloroflexota bacterium]